VQLQPLPDQDNVVYTVDRALRIVAFNAGYRRNLLSPDASDFIRQWGVGSSVLDAISPDLRAFYHELFARALAGEPVEHRYQCPQPTRYREFRMRLLPDPRRERVMVEHALLLEHELPDGGPVDEATIRARYQRDGVIAQCCHCRKVRRRDGVDAWDWVGSLIARSWPGTSHGLCPPCFEYYYPEADAAG
jgi:hypothetical protein